MRCCGVWPACRSAGLTQNSLNDDAWGVAAMSAGSGHALPKSPLPRGRALELAGLAFTLASVTAKARPEAACIMFGMRRVVAEAFAGFTIETIHRLGQTRAHLGATAVVRVTRRLAAHDRYRRSIRGRSSASGFIARYSNRILVDIEPAT